jgi:ribosomal protein L22
MADGARDADTEKKDQPTEQEGAGTPAKAEPEAEAKPKRTRAKAEPKAEEKPKAKAGSKPKAESKAKAEKKADAEEPKAEDKPKAGDKPAPAARSRRRRERETGEPVTVRAQARYVRTSARKARLIADHVRGKDVAEARALLQFSPRAVAEDWRKLLESAIANAEHNHDLVGDDLRVLNATADEGPTLKRFRPRAHGRATRIRKRTSHLTITLTPKEN